MKSVVFPHEFFDLPAVHDLPLEAKLLLAAAWLHPRGSACGVITLTDYVAASIKMPHDTCVGIARDLARRGIATFDVETLEFFVFLTYDVWKTPAQAGAGSAWEKAVNNAIDKVRSMSVRCDVLSAIECAPAGKLRAVALATNALTSIPPRSGGGDWSASELLVYLSVMSNPAQTAGGVLVVDPAAVGALASMPPATVCECLQSLDASDALIFDAVTREVFVSARLHATHAREKRAIESIAKNARSRRIRHAARHEAKRRFPDLFAVKTRTVAKNISETDSCSLVDAVAVADAIAVVEVDADFSQLATAMGRLCQRAALLNKNSDIELDHANVEKAISAARSCAIDDASAAAAVEQLLANGGWPRQAADAIRRAHADSVTNAALHRPPNGYEQNRPPGGYEGFRQIAKILGI